MRVVLEVHGAGVWVSLNTETSHPATFCGSFYKIGHRRSWVAPRMCPP